VAGIVADLRSASTRLVANQPQSWTRHREFMESLWQAIAIILVISSWPRRPRRPDRRAVLPLTLAIVFPIMQIADIDLQRISLGA